MTRVDVYGTVPQVQKCYSGWRLESGPLSFLFIGDVCFSHSFSSFILVLICINTQKNNWTILAPFGSQ
jgi:hypothetical protein